MFELFSPLLTIGAIVVLVVVLRRVKRYGGFKAAFNRSLSEDRQALTSARSAAASLEKQRKAELAAADKGVVDGAAEVERFENPGRGRGLTSLGPVKLFEHAVVISGQTVPLLGATARAESGPTASYLYVTDAQSRTHQASFSTEYRATGKTSTSTRTQGKYDVVTVSEEMKADYSDSQVRALATSISNAAVDEARFVEVRPALLLAARQQLVALEAQKAVVYADSEVKSRLEVAQSALTRAELAWAAKTGKANTSNTGMLPVVPEQAGPAVADVPQREQQL